MASVQGFPTKLGLDGLLSENTRKTWIKIRSLLPDDSYLAGGTGVVIYLKHRESNDLDFFTSSPLDVELLLEELYESGIPFRSTRTAPKAGNIAIIVGSTKVEFSDASSVKRLEPTTTVAGIEVAGLGDLLAMKLKAITSRKVLRDYEDLKAIETLGGRRVEEGIALAIERYSVKQESGGLVIATAISEIEKCPEDSLVRTPHKELIEYWHDRLPLVVASLSRFEVPLMSVDEALEAMRRAGRDAGSIELPKLKTVEPTKARPRSKVNSVGRTRICGYPTQQTGQPCQHLVSETATRCESGHPCLTGSP